MWADRETARDLLNFGVLVESIIGLLNKPQLIPLAVGVDGDWGSGKSSLLLMVQDRIADERPDLLSVRFSPWMHEGYSDSKLALVDTILQAVRERSPQSAEEVSVLRQRLRQLLNYRGTLSKAAGLLAGVGAAAAGAPEAAVAATSVAEHGATEALDAIEGHDSRVVDDEAITAPTMIAQFRDDFAALVAGIEGLEGVVVFVDDVDRCLPDTVVETFEMIRLFAEIEATAFIIAAHRDVVSAAIDARYASLGYVMEGDDLGNRYLEKIWHTTLRVPPLTGPEVETYLNLLMCVLHVPEESCDAVLNTLLASRDPMDYLSAIDADDVRSSLDGSESERMASDLRWVMNISDAIERGMRGNPRQIKRFANRLLLAQEVLAKRGFDPDTEVLAKLVLLDETAPGDFTTLMRWAVQDGGPPQALADAESAENPADIADENIRSWATSPIVENWLTLEPSLAGVDLRPYIQAARDRSGIAGSGRGLSDDEAELLQRLTAKADNVRNRAVAKLLARPVTDQQRLRAALRRDAVRRPRSGAPTALLKVAENDPQFLLSALDTLKQIPPDRVPISLPTTVALQLQDHPESTRPLLERWGDCGVPRVERAAQQALRHLDEDS